MSSIKGFLMLCGCAVLAGCGDSTPVDRAAEKPQAVVEASPRVTGAAEVAPAPQAQLVLAPFTGSLENVVVSEDCGLDAVDGAHDKAYSLDHTKPVQVSGWAADRKLAAPPEVAKLILRGNSSFSADLPINQVRTDVAAALNKKEFSKAGYNALIDLSAVTPGKYRLSIVYPVADKMLACTSTSEIAIK